MAGESQAEKFRKMLWPKVEDPASAVEALKLGQWVGLIIVLGYALALGLAFGAGQWPDGTEIADEEELIGLVFIYIVLIVVALLFWWLVRRGIAWAVLVLAAWGLVEAVLKLLGGIGGGGIALAILLLLFAVNGARGWLGLRKFGKPGGGTQFET